MNWSALRLLRADPPAATALALAVAGGVAALVLGTVYARWWAAPLFSAPLLMTALVFRRYAAVRATYRQTIRALARATEVAGYTPEGHAQRVAALARATGRALRVRGHRLTALEYAALLHDIGQLSLFEPLPDGATVALPAARRRAIAALGATVAREAGAGETIAHTVELQAEPYREQPLAARIVRTANAYADLAPPHRPCAERALSALEREAGTEYDPEVVRALAQIVSRGAVA
ncbi:HD-GYP domain-containing protein [Streptomyces sp. NPDC059853]|uniref:HD-GYP domain-containing protein n=1 Tax=Streptomyces sp. NPDC059853 TaxID=3346973 RepID=UPI00365C9453